MKELILLPIMAIFLVSICYAVPDLGATEEKFLSDYQMIYSTGNPLALTTSDFSDITNNQVVVNQIDVLAPGIYNVNFDVAGQGIKEISTQPDAPSSLSVESTPPPSGKNPINPPEWYSTMIAITGQCWHCEDDGSVIEADATILGCIGNGDWLFYDDAIAVCPNIEAPCFVCNTADMTLTRTSMLESDCLSLQTLLKEYVEILHRLH